MVEVDREPSSPPLATVSETFAGAEQAFEAALTEPELPSPESSTSAEAGQAFEAAPTEPGPPSPGSASPVPTTGLALPAGAEPRRSSSDAQGSTAPSNRPPDTAAPKERARLQKRPPLPPQTRAEQLQDYLDKENREVDLRRALSAIKLRRAAEVYAPKDEGLRAERLRPRPMQNRVSAEQLAEMESTDVDRLIDQIEADPSRYSRTDLTEVAQRHLMASFKMDYEEYRQGIRAARPWEAVHSDSSRVLVAGSSAIVSGLTGIPDPSPALHAGIEAARAGAHFSSQSIASPFLSGYLRVVTNNKMAYLRSGGHPVVAANISSSRDMGKVAADGKQKLGELRAATERLRTAREAEPEFDVAKRDVRAGAFALHAVADGDYKSRIGFNRSLYYSKMYGTGVNGIAAAASAVTIDPHVGHIAGPAIQAATVPLQEAAGILDEETKHRYNHYANVKWGKFIKAEAGETHYKKLQPEHVDEAALRRAFATGPSNRIFGIRAVYLNQAGELTKQYAEMRDRTAESDTSATGETPVAMSDLERKIASLKEQIANFESFDEASWMAIPADSLIGQCLDNPDVLQKASKQARLDTPGELSAEYLQRFSQGFQGGVSNAITQPLADVLQAVPELQVPTGAGADTTLHHNDVVGLITENAAGNAAFTAATGEVRVDKDRNKREFAAQAKTEAGTTPPAERGIWSFKVNEGTDHERSIDLRPSAGYDNYVHSALERKTRAIKALPHAMISGPVGLVHQLSAMRMRHQAPAALQEALSVLDERGVPKLASAPTSERLNTLSGLKDRFSDYDYRDQSPATEPTPPPGDPDEISPAKT